MGIPDGNTPVIPSQLDHRSGSHREAPLGSTMGTPNVGPSLLEPPAEPLSWTSLGKPIWGPSLGNLRGGPLLVDTPWWTTAGRHTLRELPAGPPLGYAFWSHQFGTPPSWNPIERHTFGDHLCEIALGLPLVDPRGGNPGRSPPGESPWISTPGEPPLGEPPVGPPCLNLVRDPPLWPPL
jgi:hypothetical protein